MHKKREMDKQINRLSALSGAERMSEAGWDELRAALATSANDEHAERVVSAWVKGHRWLPAPADLYALIDSIGSGTKAEPDRRCPLCQGSGFRLVWLLVTYNRHPSGEVKAREEAEIDAAAARDLTPKVDGPSQIVTSAAKACTCSYGQALYGARVVEAAKREEAATSRKARRAG